MTKPVVPGEPDEMLDYYGVPRCGDVAHRINELGQMYRRAMSHPALPAPPGNIHRVLAAASDLLEEWNVSSGELSPRAIERLSTALKGVSALPAPEPPRATPWNWAGSLVELLASGEWERIRLDCAEKVGTVLPDWANLKEYQRRNALQRWCGVVDIVVPALREVQQ